MVLGLRLQGTILGFLRFVEDLVSAAATACLDRLSSAQSIGSFQSRVYHIHDATLFIMPRHKTMLTLGQDHDYIVTLELTNRETSKYQGKQLNNKDTLYLWKTITNKDTLFEQNVLELVGKPLKKEGFWFKNSFQIKLTFNYHAWCLDPTNK